MGAADSCPPRYLLEAVLVFAAAAAAATTELLLLLEAPEELGETKLGHDVVDGIIVVAGGGAVVVDDRKVPSAAIV